MKTVKLSVVSVSHLSVKTVVLFRVANVFKRKIKITYVIIIWYVSNIEYHI